MRKFIAIATLVFAGACLSPTLPLPPPAEPDQITLSAEGVWDVRGTCTPGATVLIQNVSTGVIFGTEDQDYNGRYFLQVDAQACDVAEVIEIVDSTVSSATYFVLESVTNSVPDSDVCTPDG